MDVTEIHELNELIDGAEIYSVITEKEVAEKYIHVIKERSKYLHEACLQKTFLMN
jgi:hypothetical protein